MIPRNFRICTVSTFHGFSELLVQCAKISSLWGGGMCILFEICEKRPFQKCMGGGGSETIFLQNRGPLLGFSAICPRSLQRSATQVSLCRGMLQHVATSQHNQIGYIDEL